MRINLLAVIISLFLSICPSRANIEVVYPHSADMTVNSSSIFILGNTDYGSSFFVNDEPMKLYENSFFVKTLPLEYGVNKFVLKSIKGDVCDEKTLIFTRNMPAANKSKVVSAAYSSFPENEYYSAFIVKENATIRTAPSQNSDRVIDLPPSVMLYLSGKMGDYYKISENGDTDFWIHKSNIDSPVKASKKVYPMLIKIAHDEDKNYHYKKFYLSYPAMYTLKQENNKIVLTIHGVQTFDENHNILPYYKYEYTPESKILGYDCYYSDNILVFRTAKTPNIKNTRNVLHGINIFVDAGHGGSEKGSVGPTGVCEKDVNLSISNYLIKMLKDAGANVSYSRITDEKVGLYDRVNLAKKNNALISISIHANALPIGKDPYITHGSEVHYYNKNSIELAQIIQNNLVNDLNLKNNGIHKSSFALTRSTNPVSVLVEVAYMINPDEYILLKNQQFRYNAAKSVMKSIEEYIFSLQNKDI